MPVEYLKSSGLLLQLERLCEVQIRQMQVPPLRWKVSSPYTSSSEVTEPVVHEIECTLWERLRQYCKILASWSDYTDFTERSRSWEAISSSACQESPRILLNRSFIRTLKLPSFALYPEPDNPKYILQATTRKSLETGLLQTVSKTKKEVWRNKTLRKLSFLLRRWQFFSWSWNSSCVMQREVSVSHE